MIKLPQLSSVSDYERDPLWPRQEATWQPSGNWGIPQVPAARPFARRSTLPLPTGDSLSHTAPARTFNAGDPRTDFVAPSIEPLGWQQAAAPAARGLGSTRFRSAAVYAEVKLMEALSRGRKPSSANVPLDDGGGGGAGGGGDGSGTADIAASAGAASTGPDAFRTAVCCQLLSELCALGGPFERVLSRIREELVRAVYSDYYLSDAGTLAFEQTPYFVVVRRLEAEKDALMADRERWRAELLDRQGDVGRIEGRVSLLEEDLAAKDAANAQLRVQLARVTTERDEAETRAHAALRDLKMLQKDMLRARDEVAEARESVHSRQRAQLEETERLRGEVRTAQLDLQLARHERDSERAASEDQVPRRRLDMALGEAAELRAKLAASRGAMTAEMEELGRSMTPRPEWPQITLGLGADPFGRRPGSSAGDGAGAGAGGPGRTLEKSVSTLVPELLLPAKPRTRDMAADLCKALLRDRKDAIEARDEAARTKPLAEAAGILATLLPPEPEPGWLPPAHADGEMPPSGLAEATSAIDAAAAAQDRAAAIAAAAAAPPPEREPALGTGAHVPRCLRWAGEVPVRALDLPGTEALIAQIWDAKAKADSGRRRPALLQEHLFDYFWARNLGRGQAAVVEGAYSLLVGVRRFRAASWDVELFGAVLEGAAPEELRADAGRMLAAAAAALAAAARDGAVGLAAASGALRGLFPHRAEGALAALDAALAADAGLSRAAAAAAAGAPIDFSPAEEAPLAKLLPPPPAAVVVLDEGGAPALPAAGPPPPGKRTRTAEALLRQHLADALSYAAELEDALRGAALGLARTSLSKLRAAIARVDPHKTPAELDAYMARGTRTWPAAVATAGPAAAAGAEGEPPLTARGGASEADVSDFVAALRGSGLLKRSGARAGPGSMRLPPSRQASVLQLMAEGSAGAEPAPAAAPEPAAAEAGEAAGAPSGSPPGEEEAVDAPGDGAEGGPVAGSTSLNVPEHA